MITGIKIQGLYQKYREIIFYTFQLQNTRKHDLLLFLNHIIIKKTFIFIKSFVFLFDLTKLIFINEINFLELFALY